MRIKLILARFILLIAATCVVGIVWIVEPLALATFVAVALVVWAIQVVAPCPDDY